jgi:spermidine synthase
MSETPRAAQLVFFLTIFTAGLCSIVYELLISTTSGYFMGDSIKQFSLVIGVYMAAMGLGSYLSQFINDNLAENFVKIEILLGLTGGISVPLLYYTFTRVTGTEYQFVMLGLTAVIGVLTGFEVPILVRILKEQFTLKSNLAYVLSLDYVGALLASLLFPFLLLPFVGTFKTSLIFGFINVMLGLLVYYFMTGQEQIRRKKSMIVSGVVVLLFFIGMGIGADRILNTWEQNLYTSRLVFSEQTPYQKLVLTKNGDDLRLYINRIIQFSTIDEYRYHESLALIPLAAARQKKNILILGGGEGLLAREVLKDPKVEQITVVDLDEKVFEIARENVHLSAVNEHALDHPKVKTVAADAATFLQESAAYYDLIFVDLPDPSNDALSRLYSTSFYRLIHQRLGAEGIFVTQATGTFHTNNAFWCIFETVNASEFDFVYPYHTYVPSFGDWGFVAAAKYPLDLQHYEANYPVQYLTPDLVENMFYFEKDITNPGGIQVNHLDRPVILNYFLKDWERWRKDKE